MIKAYPQQISNSVYLLGNKYFKSYLVQGEKCALVEGGVSWSAPDLVQQLGGMGITNVDLQYLIIPHAHFDHVCGIPSLKEAFPQLKILATAYAAKILEKEKVVSVFFNEDRALSENLAQNEQGQKVVSKTVPPAVINVDRVISEGEQLDLDKGCTLDFILIPGHSPCSMAPYLPSEQVLFASDSAGYPLDEDIFPMYFAGYEDYVVSLHRMLSIEVSVLACPHEFLIMGKEDVRSYLNRSLAKTLQVHEFILEAERTGKSREDISQELFDRFYKKGLANQSATNIKGCTDLLVRRSLETVTG